MPFSPGEQHLLDDLNEFVRQTSDLLEDEPQTSGIRPPPQIEVTETTLDTTRFGFEFGPQPTAEVEPPTPPEPATCPPGSTTEITIAFSAITVCGCVDNAPDGDPIPDPPYPQWLWIDTGLNTSYVLTRDGMDSTHWFLHPAGTIDVNSWLPLNRTCPDDPFLESNVEFNLDAYCSGGIWTVIMSFGEFPGGVGSPAWAFFYGTSASPVSNSVPSCGYPPSFNTDHGYFKGAAQDGTATISW